MIALWHAEHRQAHLVLQALCGVFAFSYALERRERFWLRLVIAAFVGMLLVDMFSSLLWGLGMAGEILSITILYLILIGITCFCSRTSLWTAMFVASSGYIAQDIASRFKYLLRLDPGIDAFFPTSLGVVVSDLVCYGGVYLLAYFIFRPRVRQGEEIFDDRLKVVFSVLVLAICSGLPRLFYPQIKAFTPLTILAMNLYQILCGCFVLIIQYGVLERAGMTRQMDAMRELLHQQRVQYETSKDNSQLVNEKYHDLKRLLSDFRGRVPDEQLDKLERHISVYNTYIQTGSEVLDVVLAEKQIQCSQRGIQITCYADGAALNFMEKLDLYSLLNNALTNAIEATEKLPEGERFVTLTVAHDEGMVTIHVENSCQPPAEMEDGLPKSQRDPRYHGFGMKSMVRVAEKYSGTLAAKYRDHMFNLDIILFVPG